ncbi:porin [Basfia succiniciproducens]|uniref:Outer membrane protein (Porin) n=1 Tax=Basfia succiniciproducens TaxID=653940 RepID=A0A1G5AJ05_9PAST|nr:porin [Basfia succiniciproducens]QIM68661.1 OmpC protein [Basfia succiniciproducens]SCX77867.1 Outer membrane protein (porin) [Basfia succiniciproducens]
MKKTLVALAVAATTAAMAVPATAATVYEQDGAKVELSGSFRAFLGRVGDDNRGDLKNDGSRVYVKASQDLGNGLSAFAGYQIRFEEEAYKTAQKGSDSDFGDPTTRELYAGIKHVDIGALSFGRQNTNSDDFLDDAAYYTSASLSPLTTRSDKSVKFKSAEWNGFSFGLDYLFGDSDKLDVTNDGNYKNGYAAVLFYHNAIGEHAYNLKALYSQDRYEGFGSETGVKKTQWGLHAGYNYGPFDAALSYVNYRTKFETGYFGTVGQVSLAREAGIVDDAKGNYILLDAGYRVIPESRLYVQWERLDAKADDADYTAAIRNQYTAGIDYRLHKNVVPYIEYAHTRTKFANAETEKDNTFGVGLRVFF